MPFLTIIPRPKSPLSSSPLAHPHPACIVVAREHLQSEPPFWLPAEPTPVDRVGEAAFFLRDTIEKATEVRLPVLADDDRAVSGVTIQVGQTSLPGPARGSLPADLDEDGFIISVHLRSVRTVLIRGGGPWGTEFGVYDFLERELGVRWLLPGPDGAYVPKHRGLVVELGTRRVEPAFRSRRVTGLGAVDGWARRNRMRGRLGSRPEGFHHNLWKLVLGELDLDKDTEVEDFYSNHKEFFPKQIPFLDLDDYTIGWQPCFSAPSLVEFAIKRIVDYFDEHTDARCYSLGVNDGGGYCRCGLCQPAAGEEPNDSELYYTWTHEVIEGVYAAWQERIDSGQDLSFDPEEKWFGCLAYARVIEPPEKAPVHKKLLPFLTYDRIGWLDPVSSEADVRRTEAWGKKAERLGWYDYAEGTPYCVPRIYTRHMQGYLAWAHEQGVREIHAEGYPNFGEGPKPYILLRLLWDPFQDPTELLAEWCRLAVGEKAAPYLERYYRIWECFWMNDAPFTAWFQEGASSVFLDMNDPAYLARVPENAIADCRVLFEEIAKRPGNAEQIERARILEEAFQYYEASVLAHRGSVAQVTCETQTLSGLLAAVRATEMAAHRRQLIRDFAEDAVLRHPLSALKTPRLSGEGWGQAGLWAAQPWAQDATMPASQQLTQLAQSASSKVVREAAQAVLEADPEKTPVVDPLFEEPGAPAWTLKEPAYHSVAKSHTSGGSICCEGKSAYSLTLRRQGPRQVVYDLEPGQYAALAWAFLESAPKNNNWNLHVSASTMHPDEPETNRLVTYRTPRLKIAPGIWTLLVLSGIKVYTWRDKTTPLRVAAMAEYFGESGVLYWDEVLLFPTAGAD